MTEILKLPLPLRSHSSLAGVWTAQHGQQLSANREEGELRMTVFEFWCSVYVK